MILTSNSDLALSFTGKPCLLFSIKSFFQTYKKSHSFEPIKPSSVVEQLPYICNTFQAGTQQCAAEFFQNLIHKLESHRCINTNKVLISDLFQFTLQSEVMCSACGHVSTTNSKETVLSLPVTKVS
jgi:ubiquitin C-terminal hydrolase